MDKRYSYLVKNTTILTIGQFSSKMLQFFLVPLYTSVLSTREYGSYDIVANTITLLFPILTLNISDGLMRFELDKAYEKKEIKSIALRYEFLGCLLAALLTIILRIVRPSQVYNDYFVLIILLFSFTAFYQFEVQLAKGEEKVREIAIAGVIGTFITVVLNILLLVVFPMSLTGYYLAIIGGQAIPAIYLMAVTHTFQGISWHFDKNLQHEMLVYSVPLVMTTIGWWVNSASDRYVVTWMCGLDTNGIYSISYKIPTIITTVQNIFIQAWSISAIKEYKENNYQKFYGDSFFHLNSLMVATCSVLLLFTKILARILYAKEFYAAWVYVPFLLVSSVFNASSGFIGPILSARKDSKTMALSAVYGTVTNLILNIILVYFIGAQGAAIATAVSSFVIYYCRMRKVRGDIEYRGLKIILTSWLIVIIQSVLIICGVSMFVQIPFTALIVFMYRNEILKIMNMVKGRMHKV